MLRLGKLLVALSVAVVLVAGCGSSSSGGLNKAPVALPPDQAVPVPPGSKLSVEGKEACSKHSISLSDGKISGDHVTMGLLIKPSKLYPGSYEVVLQATAPLPTYLDVTPKDPDARLIPQGLHQVVLLTKVVPVGLYACAGILPNGDPGLGGQPS